MELKLHYLTFGTPHQGQGSGGEHVGLHVQEDRLVRMDDTDADLERCVPRLQRSEVRLWVDVLGDPKNRLSQSLRGLAAIAGATRWNRRTSGS